MPIKIPDGLPAAEILENENTFFMDEFRATHQDIRPLKIAIMNLMPTKIATETQLIRLLSNSSLQVDLTLLHTISHVSKNTDPNHMKMFYKNFFDIKDEKFDGLIITGAPVEDLEFEDVDYWNELSCVFEWAKKNVFSIFNICWASQAGLYYYYGVPKYKRNSKLSGIFEHSVDDPKDPLARGFDERFLAPHSRNTEIKREDIEKIPDLKIVASSKEAGVYIVTSKDSRRVFVTGHSEYDRDTLKNEYFRDLDKGLNPEIPENYFPENNPELTPLHSWRAHAHLLFSNWLNYCVYQLTPYNIEDIGTK